MLPPRSSPFSINVCVVLSFIMFVFLPALAQEEEGPSFQSTEIHANGSITFRSKDPNADKDASPS